MRVAIGARLRRATRQRDLHDLHDQIEALIALLLNPGPPIARLARRLRGGLRRRRGAFVRALAMHLPETGGPLSPCALLNSS